MTRIAKGIQNGELWDKVLLPNGMIGYAFQNYLEEVEQEDTVDSIFDKSLNVEGNEITGWDINKLSVSEINKLINTSYTIKIYNYKNVELKDNQIAGTGSTIKFIDENGSVQMEYCIIIYGDVNGDGKVNSIDLLVLQKHILEIETLQGAFFKAGNVRKNGQNPSSVDLLLIQKHILEIKLIEQ
jgi:hypothetical protein